MAIRNPLFDQGTIRLAQHTVNVIAGSDPRSPSCELLCELKMAGFLGRQEWEIPVQDRDDVEIYGMCRVDQAQNPAKTSPDSDQQTPINSYVSKSSYCHRGLRSAISHLCITL